MSNTQQVVIQTLHTAEDREHIFHLSPVTALLRLQHPTDICKSIGCFSFAVIIKQLAFPAPCFVSVRVRHEMALLVKSPPSHTPRVQSCREGCVTRASQMSCEPVKGLASPPIRRSAIQLKQVVSAPMQSSPIFFYAFALFASDAGHSC